MSLPSKTINVTQTDEWQRLHESIEAQKELADLFSELFSDYLVADRESQSGNIRKEGGRLVVLLLPTRFQSLHFAMRHLARFASQAEEHIEALELVGRRFERLT